MAATSVRRPIPAVVFILLLSLLSAIVWYRVLNRSPAAQQKPTTSSSHSCSPSAVATTGAKTSSKAGKTTTKSAAGKTTAITWPKTASVHVTVLNGSSRNGLASSVASALKGRGFKINGKPSNDTTDTLTVTQVRYGTHATTAARLVQLYLPGSKLVPTSTKSTAVVVSMGSSFGGHLASEAAVAGAKKRAHTTVC